MPITDKTLRSSTCLSFRNNILIWHSQKNVNSINKALIMKKHA